MSLEKLVQDVKIIAVICNQFGDTGKGKFSDYFAANWAEIIARGTGGNNAGHTVVMPNGKKRIFHLLPSGIVYDNRGKVNILGNGMVLDLDVLCSELDELDKENLSYNNLMISQDAHVIMPYHIARDKSNVSQKKGGIGSTGRGIGPVYEDKIARRGIMMRDLFNKDILAKKIKKIKEIFPKQKIKLDDIMYEMFLFSYRLKPFVRDTIRIIHDYVRSDRRILLEGAQGLLLSVEFGTYPYVTSSDCSLAGTASGVGIPANIVDLPLGLVKFPFMTRVGGGPFPSELGGRKSEEYCAKSTRKGQPQYDILFELKKYKIPFKEKDGDIKYDRNHENIVDLMNSDNEFLQGVGVRLAGEEYGATTGRARRTGWLDLAALKYAVSINGPNLVLTKADVLQGAAEFKLAHHYHFTRDPDKLYQTKPDYFSFKGFDEDISQIDDFDYLPKSILKAIHIIEILTKGKVKIVSVGPKADQTIIRD